MFIIKSVETATESNKQFKGQSQTYYFGKQEKLLSCETLPPKWEVERYGFKTKAAATKALKSLKETFEWFSKTYGTWTPELTLIEM